MKLKEIIGEELFKQLPTEKQKSYANQDLEDVSEGKYVSKERFNQVNTEAKDYKKKVAERDTQIANLKEEFKDTEGLKEKVEQLQQDNKKQEEDYQKKIEQIQMDNAIEKALASYNCKNTKIVKSLLDMEKIKVDGESVIGLKEQMESIKKTEDYLFEKAPVQGAPDFSTGSNGKAKEPENKKEFGTELAEIKAKEIKKGEEVDKFFE